MADIYEILRPDVMTATIKKVKTGVPFKLPQALTVSRRKTIGNTITYKQVQGRRETARLVAYGAPSKHRGLTGVSKQTATLIHSKEHQYFEADTMQNLLSDNGAMQALGEDEYVRQTAEFAGLFDNLRFAAIAYALAKGVIYFDEDGNLLDSSGNAAYTVDFDIPDGHKSQLDVFGDGDIISAKWSNTSTKINKQIEAIKEAATKKTGYELKYAMYGDNVPDYLMSNTTLKNLISGHNAYQKAFAEGTIPDGFLGLTWVPAGSSGSFVDSSGNYKSIWDSDLVTFTPEISKEWYDAVEGSDVVPTQLGKVEPDAATMLKNATQAFGKYSYATMQDDPVTVKQIVGDTFLPLITNPWAVFQAKVHWS